MTGRSNKKPAIPQYVPGTTLGRSGYRSSLTDRIHTHARHIDALLAMITCVDAPEDDDDGFSGFFRLNQEIQFEALDLVSSLATELHEMIEERCYEELSK